MQLRFVKSESTFSYFEATRGYIEKHGKPLALYSDKASIFREYIDVWHYPDGRKEIRLNGGVLPYSIYDRLSEVDQGAIVDNKRLGRTLELVKLVQDKRDNTRSQGVPVGNGPSRRHKKPTAHSIMTICLRL